MILLLSMAYLSYGQVGIGTDSPSSGTLLDVKDSTNQSGVLLPQVDIEDLNTVAPLPSGTELGTLVYNTNIISGAGYYFWDGSSWFRSTAYIGQMVKYGNPSYAVTGRNLNGSTTAQLVGNLEFNDNTLLYVANGDNGIKINETGVYTITVALSLAGTYGNSGDASQRSRGEIDARIFVDTAARGPLYRSTEMNVTSTAGDVTYGSLSFTQSVKVNTGQIITIRTGRSTGFSLGIVKLRSTGTSTIFIQKIL